MVIRRMLLGVALISFWFLAAAKSQDSPPTDSASQTINSASNAPLPTWLPFPIPSRLYQYWRKFGVWDYKQQGSKYRDSTQFNFGATASAAGLDMKALLALTRASKPNPEDLRSLEAADLQTQFSLKEPSLDQLRTMAEQDSHVIRIAADYTNLNNSSVWPRKDVGFSEARWNEYRSLFEKLSLQEGVVRTEDFPGAIFFVVVAKGLCTGGSSAGYFYSTEEPSPISNTPTETLNTEARNNPKRYYAFVFKKLKSNWYEFYEVDW